MPDGSPVDPLEMGDYTKVQNYRYTEPGVNGLYFGSSKHIVDCEIRSYGVNPDAANRTLTYYDNVKLDNMLDLTNPSVRQQLNVELPDLLNDSYKANVGNAVTHQMGRFASDNGYNGIIAPSARGDGGINIVLFDPKLVK